MKLEGDIGEIDLVERLVELGRQNFTGAIRFENDGIIKILYFKTGDILSASTNDRADSVDEILMRANKISRDHVKQALAKRKENETLGDALLNLGFITRKELLWARRVQVIGVIRSITNWTAGSFTMVADYLPKREEGTHFPLQQIIVELLVTEPNRVKVERQVDAGEAVFIKSPDFDGAFRSLGLNEDADAIAAQIDGKRTAAEVAGQAGKDPFNTYKLLHALATLGLLKRGGVEAAPASVPGFVDDYANAGVADAADMWTTEPEPSSPEVPAIEPALPEPGPSLDITAPPPAYEPPPPPPPPVIRSEPVPEPAPNRREPVQRLDSTATRGTQTRTRTPSSTAAPRPKAKSSSGNRFAALMAILVVAILAFAGYAGYAWWRGRSSPAPIVSQKAPVSGAQTAPAPSTTTQEQPLVVSAAPPPTATTPATTTTAPIAPDTLAASAPQPAGATTTRPTPSPAPAPVTPAAANGLRARYDSMARQFAANPSGKFTVQIALVCQTSSISAAIDGGGDRIWFTPTTYRGQSCYRLFWNRYETREAAERGIADIPAAVRSGANPVVVAIPR